MSPGAWLRLTLALVAFAAPSAAAEPVTEPVTEPAAETGRLEQAVQDAEARLEARRAELAAIDRELAASREALDRRLAELEATSQRLTALRQERQELLAEIAALDRSVEATLARIAAEEATLQDLQERVQRLMLNLYYGRPNRNLRVLVEADTLFDLRVRNHYLSLLTAQDVTLLRALDDTLARLAADERRLRGERELRAARETELATTERALADSEAQLARSVAALQSSREGQLALRRQALEEEEALASALLRSQAELEAERERLRREAELARQRELEAERERQRLEEEARQAEAAADATAASVEAARAAAAQAATARSQARAQAQDAEQNFQRRLPPVQAAETGYRLPLDNARVFSRYSTSEEWLGLQAEQAGAPVRAAKSGLVILATRLSANTGYLVTIQHEPERCTSYRNLQGPLPVSRGSQVSQGEVIGYLGGGALVRPDVLHFFVNGGAGCTSNLDPEPHLGVR